LLFSVNYIQRAANAIITKSDLLSELFLSFMTFTNIFV
jgi:hypothetical protein